MREVSVCRILLLAFAIVAAFLVCSLRAAELHPTDRGSYELYPALEMSLLVKEPEVVDPVALTFDEEGHIYVVEMRDYPLGFGPQQRPGGTIRLLEDRDGDGTGGYHFARILHAPGRDRTKP